MGVADDQPSFHVRAVEQHQSIRAETFRVKEVRRRLHVGRAADVRVVSRDCHPPRIAELSATQDEIACDVRSVEHYFALGLESAADWKVFCNASRKKIDCDSTWSGPIRCVLGVAEMAPC